MLQAAGGIVNRDTRDMDLRSMLATLENQMALKHGPEARVTKRGKQSLSGWHLNLS